MKHIANLLKLMFMLIYSNTHLNQVHFMIVTVISFLLITTFKKTHNQPHGQSIKLI